MKTLVCVIALVMAASFAWGQPTKTEVTKAVAAAAAAFEVEQQ